ncbi:MAG: hypothetical protein GEV09_11500 [Pseudonocardiaceae bacterium]|nr:hypothetical protein [Pseudonocardiaceae bacterium]
MNQSPDPEDGSQRSVAELLARYGEPSPGGRRHRRRAPDAADTPSQSTVEPGGSVPEPAAQGEPPGHGHRPAPDPEPTIAPPRAAPGPSRSGPYRSTSYGPAGSGRAANGSRDDEATRLDLPAAGGGDRFAGGAAPGSAPATEQLPRIEPGPVMDPSPAPVPPRPPDRTPSPDRSEPPAGLGGVGRRRVDLATAGHHRPDDEPAATRGSAPAAGDERPSGGREDAPAEDAPDLDETRQSGQTQVAAAPPDSGEADTAASPVREWAVVASQVGAGVIGGAVLWLVCEWLWQSIPVLALIVALAVITGLVWVVRHVRRAEDLQTTVVAVLVGLFVTVSPAALLLLGR